MTRDRATICLLLAGVVLAGCSTPSASASPTSPANQTPSQSVVSQPSATPAPELTATALSSLLDPNVMSADLAAIAQVADDSGGSRATGTAGFDDSLDYVVRELTSAGYEADIVGFPADGQQSQNLLVERAGTGSGVLILGAHLDSVADSPGMNDNASGVVALLSIARGLIQLPAPSLTVRFAFWGAEEGGPYGSAAYVASLDADARAQIRGYINADMIGSPNGITFVYDEPGAASGSAAITNVVSGYFRLRGRPWEPIDLAGDSDHGPFTEVGIPTGGLFAGGIEPVTEVQATRHGAIAGQPADPCSHAACDTLTNVNLARLALLTDALAASLVNLAATPAS